MYRTSGMTSRLERIDTSEVTAREPKALPSRHIRTNESGALTRNSMSASSVVSRRDYLNKENRKAIVGTRG
ncbi:hypothetical protein J6590_034368 [Homalodisca vitripennis]|nr:hypothetical protein J6590_034368 [Homalodisca vitripennis]